MLWVNVNKMVDERKCRLPVKMMLAFLSCLALFFYLLTVFILQKSPLPMLGGLSASAQASSLAEAVTFMGVPGGALAPRRFSVSRAGRLAPPGDGGSKPQPVPATGLASPSQGGCQLLPCCFRGSEKDPVEGLLRT